MEKIEVNQLSLWDDLLGPGMTAVVGAGGKTSLIQFMAQLSQAKGLATLVTTTTKMYQEQLAAWPLYIGEDWEEAQVFCQQAIRETGVAAWAGRVIEWPASPRPVGRGLVSDASSYGGASKEEELDAKRGSAFDYTLDPALPKVQGPGLEALYLLSQRQPSWQILVEADGARHKRLKAPKSTEPVIPPGTRQTIGVLNVSVLGQAASGDLVHNWELFRALLSTEGGQFMEERELIEDGTVIERGQFLEEGKSIEDGQIIDMPMLVKLIQSPRGLFQYSQGQKVLFCLACETLSEEALNRWVTMLAKLGLDKIVLARGWGSHIEIQRVIACR